MFLDKDHYDLISPIPLSMKLKILNIIWTKLERYDLFHYLPVLIWSHIENITSFIKYFLYS